MAALGEEILGKYCLLEKLGKGGMGQVYLARDKKLGKLWAVKETEKLDMREIRILKELSHAMLPRVVDWGKAEEKQYIVMDYIEGKSLQSLVEERGPFSRKQVLEWGMKICQVLSYLHTRKPPIIYGDLKPGNLMLDVEGNLFLVDFGAAGRHSPYRKQALCLGTRAYAAPEQMEGFLSPVSDIYALGKTLAVLAGGGRKGGAALRRIIRKCCREAPRRRYQSCENLEKALKRAAAGQGSKKVLLPLILMGVIAAFLAGMAAYGERQPLTAPPVNLLTAFPVESQKESFYAMFNRLQPELVQVLEEENPGHWRLNRCLEQLTDLLRNTAQAEGRLRCLELMGRLYELGEEHDHAQSIYEQLLLLYPEEVDAYCLYSRLLLGQGEGKEAEKLYARAAKLEGARENHNFQVLARLLKEQPETSERRKKNDKEEK